MSGRFGLNHGEQRPQYDEIDLGDLLVGLWDGKWILIGFTLAAFLIGLVYIVVPNHAQQARVEIFPISVNEANTYAPLNQTEFISISRGRLVNDFVTELRSRDIIVEAAREVLIGPDVQDPEASAVAFANNVELIAPVADDANRAHWTMTFSAASQQSAKQLTTRIVELGNAKLRNDLTQLFEQQLEFDLRSKQLRLEDLREERENALEDYTRRTEQRLAFLEEQAALARSQSLAQSALLEGNTFGRNATVTQIEADVPYYFAGYVAIEKEIEMIENRENKENFVPQLTEIDQNIRQIQQDRSAARARAAFAATPLATDQFAVINYDSRDIQFTPTIRRSLILVASIMLGGFIGLMVLIMRNALRSRKAA